MIIEVMEDEEYVKHLEKTFVEEKVREAVKYPLDSFMMEEYFVAIEKDKVNNKKKEMLEALDSFVERIENMSEEEFIKFLEGEGFVVLDYEEGKPLIEEVCED